MEKSDKSDPSDESDLSDKSDLSDSSDLSDKSDSSDSSDFAFKICVVNKKEPRASCLRLFGIMDAGDYITRILRTLLPWRWM